MIRCDTKSDYELLDKLRLESTNYQTSLKKQEEFIEYLENLLTIKKQKANTVRAYQRTVIPIQEILINFKEIIGVKNEK